MTALAQAWRALARRRAFTIVAILTLATGAGVTATVFSLVNAVVWTPLPFPQAAWHFSTTTVAARDRLPACCSLPFFSR